MFEYRRICVWKKGKEITLMRKRRGGFAEEQYGEEKSAGTL